VVRCRYCLTCDRGVVVSNPAHGCCVPTPTQHAIPPGSVNQYQLKQGSKRARAYHAMHWPRIHGLAALVSVRLRAKETDISAAAAGLYPAICFRGEYETVCGDDRVAEERKPRKNIHPARKSCMQPEAIRSLCATFTAILHADMSFTCVQQDSRDSRGLTWC